MKHILRKALLAGAVGFVGLQFVPVPDLPASTGGPRRNPMLDAGMPPALAASMYRSCGNCHTNATAWPWYGRVAPVSWLLARDVERARKTLNFSEWNKMKPALAAGKLLTACESLRQGRMPLPAYLMLHPESRLSSDEVVQFCEWSRSEAKELLKQSRRAPALP